MYRNLLKSIDGFVVAGCFWVAMTFSGELSAEGGIQSLHVVNDVTFDAGGKPIITPRVVTINQQNRESQRNQEADYEAARAALYQSGSVEDRILRAVGGPLGCGTLDFRDFQQPVVRKNRRETLIEKAQLTLPDTQLNAVLVKLLKKESTLDDRQVEDVFRILDLGGDDGWKSIEIASRDLATIVATVNSNIPPWRNGDYEYVDLAQEVYYLCESRLRARFAGGVPERRLKDDVAMRVLQNLSDDPKVSGSHVDGEIDGLLRAVRNSKVSKRWQ